ncbi:hypothetical protein RF11_13407 [Thelohanellus kitauei]|uniref:Uncharacterized protein n=1 Tax=Thelohanellus kitauei TaxID=669202 RepID=A0A0C2N091_THEKT|nr:hypothetical protein RF11_13407 [Thelohanellus kitauei]
MTVRKADELKKLNKFEEAALRYIEAAELAPHWNVCYLTIISLYEKATECYIKIENIRAYECYNKALDVNIKQEALFEKLYTKGENLRSKHHLEHTCVITKFSAPEIEEKNKRALQEVVHNAVQLRNKARADLDQFIKEQTAKMGQNLIVSYID